MLHVPLTQHFICWVQEARDCLFNFSWPINNIMLATAVQDCTRPEQRKKCQKTSRMLLISEVAGKVLESCLGKYSFTAPSGSKTRIKASSLISPEDSNNLKINNLIWARWQGQLLRKRGLIISFSLCLAKLPTNKQGFAIYKGSQALEVES